MAIDKQTKLEPIKAPEPEVKAPEPEKGTSVKAADSSTQTVSKQDRPEVKESENTEPQFYVHLANGEVMRCVAEDLPAPGGSNAVHGFWQKGTKSFQVIGVYEVESETE